MVTLRQISNLFLFFSLSFYSFFAFAEQPPGPPYQLLWVDLGAHQCIEGGCTRYYVFSRPFPIVPDFKLDELDPITHRKAYKSIHDFKVEMDGGKVLNWKIVLRKTIGEDFSNYQIKVYYLIGDGDPIEDGGVFVYGPSADLNNIPHICMETKIPYSLMGENFNIDPYLIMNGDYARKVEKLKKVPHGAACSVYL